MSSLISELYPTSRLFDLDLPTAKISLNGSWQNFERSIRALGGIVGSRLNQHIQTCSNRNLIERYWSNDVSPCRIVQAGIDFINAETVSIMVGRGGSIIKTFSELYKVLIFTPLKGEPPLFIVQGPMENVLMASKKLFQIKENIRKMIAKTGKLDLSLFLGDVMISREMAVPQHLCGRIIGKHGLIINCIKRRCGVEIRSPTKDLLNGEMDSQKSRSTSLLNSSIYLGSTVNFIINAFIPLNEDQRITLGHIKQAMQLISIYIAWPTRKEMQICSNDKKKEIYYGNISSMRHLWPVEFQEESYESALEIRSSINMEIQKLTEFKLPELLDQSIEGISSPTSSQKIKYVQHDLHFLSLLHQEMSYLNISRQSLNCSFNSSNRPCGPQFEAYTFKPASNSDTIFSKYQQSPSVIKHARHAFKGKSVFL